MKSVKQEDFVFHHNNVMDAVHPEHNAMTAYGWIKKGEKRLLKTNSGRQRLNLHGAINIETMDTTIIESKTVDAESTIELLEILNQKYSLSKKIYIILDNAKYHYSKTVKEYLKSCKRIKLVFLPAYSPELNLIERLWRYYKQEVLYNTYYESIIEFRNASIYFFQDISSHKKNLFSLLSGGFEGFSYT